MSFAPQADESGSDRLLMFSMLGIVLVIGLAFGISLLNRKQALPSVQPAAVPIVAPQQTSPSDVQSPTAPVPANPQSVQPQQQPALDPPIYVPEQPANPPVSVDPNPPVRAMANRKLQGMAEATRPG